MRALSATRPRLCSYFLPPPTPSDNCTDRAGARQFTLAKSETFTDEGYRVPHGFLRGRSYHRSPQAHLCYGEAPAASGRPAGALDGRGSPGRIFLIKLSYAEGEVRVISGSSGSADGFQVARPRSPGVIDMFPVLIFFYVKRRIDLRGKSACSFTSCLGRTGRLIPGELLSWSG